MSLEAIPLNIARPAYQRTHLSSHDHTLHATTGWIPTRVVNMSLEAIPLNIARLRGALARLSPDFAARLSSLNRLQVRACVAVRVVCACNASRV